MMRRIPSAEIVLCPANNPIPSNRFRSIYESSATDLLTSASSINRYTCIFMTYCMYEEKHIVYQFTTKA